MPTTNDGKPGEVVRILDLGWGVKAMAFSPAGNWLAMGKPDRALILHDLVKNQRLDIRDDLELLRSVEVCRFTPSGSHVLAAGRSGMIAVFEVSSEGRLKQSEQYVGHNEEVVCIAVSDDGKYALSGGNDKTLHYWKIEGGEQIATFPGFEGPVKACQFVSGRSAIATDGATLIQVNLTKQSVDRELALARSWVGQAAAFSPDGNFVAVCDGYDVFRWNLKESAEMPKLADNETQWSLAFTPDGTRLLCGGRGKINIWDFRKGAKLHSLAMAADVHYVQCLAVSPDGKYCAAIGSSAGQDVQVFQLPTRRR